MCKFQLFPCMSVRVCLLHRQGHFIFHMTKQEDEKVDFMMG